MSSAPSLSVRPDPFQVEALEHLSAGRSVLVCAPTGSGKTLIAEISARNALDRGDRLFYTTPLKALSNQKFRDMGALFGEKRCGLLTGDISIRPDAPLVVMTTEVFRNMLMRGSREDRLASVQYVVLDECHYIGKYDRGTAWEEAILSCPPGVQLVALSATVANPTQIAGWMDRVHPVTALVQSIQRPVPLKMHYCREGVLEPLLPDAAPASGAFRARRRSRGPAVYSEPEDPAAVVETLASADLLPAIYFAFSRRGCEIAMQACAPLQLLSPNESAHIRDRIQEWRPIYPSLSSYPFLGLLERGLAIHHAGMLPGWRAPIERLFQQKLLKVIFATETLAAGINMPARTTVISSLRRPGEHGFRPLTPTEFHQMAGRAGRRGMDTLGHLVVLADPQIEIAVARMLAISPPEPLGSALSPGYGLVLNWLAAYGEAESRRKIVDGLGMYAAHAAEFAGTSPLFCPAWSRFTAARAVLEKVGALEGDRAVGPGLLTAALQTENELLAAQLLEGALPEAPAPEAVAAIASGVGTVSGRGPARGRGSAARPIARDSRRDAGFRLVMDRALEVALSLRRVQQEHHFTCATSLSREMAWLAWIWTGGASWGEVLDSTELDEGDIAYGFRNTLDLLHQIHSSPARPAIRDAAADACARIDRPPVSEVL